MVNMLRGLGLLFVISQVPGTNGVSLVLSVQVGLSALLDATAPSAWVPCDLVELLDILMGLGDGRRQLSR